MAPELRKRKSKESSISAAKPASKVKTGAPKRKAAEDASPVAVKKSKSIREDGRSEVKPSKSRLSETKPAKSSRSTKASKDEKDQTNSGDEDAQLSDNEEDEAQALALAELVDSDEEDEPVVDASEAFKEGQDVGKVPKASKKLAKSSEAEDGEPGVVYIGRIPHGFYEHQMNSYFSQFGKINKLRISRNKKTGASKHFAFIEFAEAPVAEIVTKTMDNYVLFGHLLKVKLVPKSQVHENIWKGSNKRFKKIPWNKMAGNSLKKPLSQSAWAGKITKEEKRRSDRAKKLSEMGYEYEGPQLKVVDDVLGDAAAIEGADEEVPKAIEAAPEVAETTKAEPQAADKEVENGAESLDAELAVEKPAKASKKSAAKSSKKAKKSSKTKKAST
ncbi:hypothetical protein F5B20DRAFT_357887 [Whalleya microplaca]|nr:hypothetical protein F5B20DRAFT_357887 [Whalleya microplaca]